MVLMYLVIDQGALRMLKIPRTIILTIVLTLLGWVNGYTSELPRFMGIYVLEGDKYIEVPQYSSTEQEYNYRDTLFYGMAYRDFNVRDVIKRSAFVRVDATKLSEQGFLVVQDPEWSDFRVFRVPHVGKWVDNGKGDDIVISVTARGTIAGGSVWSDKGLDPKVDPTPVGELKKAKVGDNSYVYVPAKPLEKGFYLIKYKKNGENIVGYHTIQVTQRCTSESRTDSEAQYRLGFEYLDGGEFQKNPDEAFNCFIKSAEQGHVGGQAMVAVFYATSKDPNRRNGNKAIYYALKAVDQEPNKWNLLGVLASAYAQDGQFDKAIETQDRAIKLLNELKSQYSEDRLKKLADDQNNRLTLYQQHKVYLSKGYD